MASPAKVSPAALVLPPPMPGSRDDRPVIVVDAGPGGVDPGATGTSGIYEQDLTLAIAKALKRQLDARSDERRGGKEGVSACRSRWSPTHSQHKDTTTNNH